MLTTSINIDQIPEIYDRFARAICEKHWRRRATKLKQAMKGNEFLGHYLHIENSLTFQLERLGIARAQYGRIPSSLLSDPQFYPAISFCAQILSIMESSPRSQAVRLKRRLQGAFRNPDELRAIRLELTAATHFNLRGYTVSWPEMNGSGRFDLFVEGIGSQGLEVECKSISPDKGRKIHRREALDFYRLLWASLRPLRTSLRTGISVVLTVPTRLPSTYQKRLALAKRVAGQILEGRSGTFEDGETVHLTDFDPALLGPSPSRSDPEQMRAAADTITGTNNREVMVIGTPAGGVMAFALQSMDDDAVVRAVFNTLSDSAKRQFSNTRPGIFLVGLEGLNSDQLNSVATQEVERPGTPTPLRLGVNRFLCGAARRHIVGVAFLSRNELASVQEGVVGSGGAAYYFPRRESPFWDEVFSGLFA